MTSVEQGSNEQGSSLASALPDSVSLGKKLSSLIPPLGLTGCDCTVGGVLGVG